MSAGKGEAQDTHTVEHPHDATDSGAAENLPPANWFEAAGFVIDPQTALRAIHRLFFGALISRKLFFDIVEKKGPKAALGQYLDGLGNTFNLISKDLGLDVSLSRRSGLWEGAEILVFAGDALISGDTRTLRRNHIRKLALISVEIIHKGCHVPKKQARREVAEIINKTVSGVFPKDHIAPATIKDWAVRKPKPEALHDIPLPPEGMPPERIRGYVEYIFGVTALGAKAAEVFKSEGIDAGVE